MQIIIRYAKRDKDNGEIVREKIIGMKTTGTQHFNWHEAVAVAIFHSQPGERIVALIEKGYE